MNKKNANIFVCVKRCLTSARLWQYRKTMQPYSRDRFRRQFCNVRLVWFRTTCQTAGLRRNDRFCVSPDIQYNLLCFVFQFKMRSLKRKVKSILLSKILNWLVLMSSWVKFGTNISQLDFCTSQFSIIIDFRDHEPTV